MNGYIKKELEDKVKSLEKEKQDINDKKTKIEALIALIDTSVEESGFKSVRWCHDRKDDVKHSDVIFSHFVNNFDIVKFDDIEIEIKSGVIESSISVDFRGNEMHSKKNIKGFLFVDIKSHYASQEELVKTFNIEINDNQWDALYLGGK